MDGRIFFKTLVTTISMSCHQVDMDILGLLGSVEVKEPSRQCLKI